MLNYFLEATADSMIKKSPKPSKRKATKPKAKAFISTPRFVESRAPAATKKRTKSKRLPPAAKVISPLELITTTAFRKPIAVVFYKLIRLQIG